MMIFDSCPKLWGCETSIEIEASRKNKKRAEPSESQTFQECIQTKPSLKMTQKPLCLSISDSQWNEWIGQLSKIVSSYWNEMLG